MHGKKLVLWFLAAMFFMACGGGGAGVDTIDRATLKEGETVTKTLKFWMKERGIKGDDLADNAHFDDGANNRVVLWLDAALKDKVASLEQGKAYKVTFKHEAGDALVYGTLTAVE